MCAHATIALLAGSPGSGVPAADGPIGAERAVEALRRAVAAAQAEPGLLRIEPVLGPLRGRADFRALLMDADFPADPIGR